MTILLNSKESTAPNRYHWTVEAFYRAIDAGVFDAPERMELLNGELWEKENVNPPHAATIRKIARLFRATLPETFLVMEEKPIHLERDGEPCPDVTIVFGTEEDFEERHPTPDDVRLLIEVADSSVERDTGEKAILYAQAGIPEYWVSLLRAREVRVYLDPVDGVYQNRQTFREEDTISPLVAPQVVVSVADLLTRRREAESV